MSETSTSKSTLKNSIAERLKAKFREDQQLIDDLTRSELKKLASELSKLSSDVLNTTKNDLEAARRAVRRAMVWRWIPPILIGLSLSAGIFGGSWVVMRYLSQRVESLLTEIERLGRNAAALKAHGGQVKVVRQDGHVYLLMPPGTETYECGGDNGRYVCAKLPK